MASRSLSKPCCKRPAILAASIFGFLALSLAPQRAVGQTWTGATSGDWNTATNWSPATVPNGGGKIATFDISGVTAVSLSAQFTQIGGLTFTSNATSSYTISANSGTNLFLFGSIVNNSGTTQKFESMAGSKIAFANGASADSLTQFTTDSATTSGGSVGLLDFSSISTAGSATIINQGGTVAGAGGGSTMFEASAKAGSATITTNGGTNGGYGGATYFAGSADGGTARAITNGNGSFDISWLDNGGMKIGSIEGSGNYYLGGNSLTVGGNNLSTTVSGVIADGGIGNGTGGSLIKNGSGTLTLTGANTYTGGTTVNAGTVQLGTAGTAGTLSGTGTISVNNGGTFQVVNAGGTPLYEVTIANNMSNGVGGVGTVNISSANSNLLTGTLTDGAAGKLGLTQSGSGMNWVLNANNTYSGPTIITGGILQIGNSPIGANLPGSIGSSSSVNISGGGSLWLANVTGSVFSNNVTTSVVGSTGTLNVTNSTSTPITLSGALTDTVAGQLTLKVTSGGAILTGTANSYHGATVVTGLSTLQIGTTASASSIGSSAVIDVNNSGTFVLTNVSGNQFSNTITNLTGSGPYPDATVRVDAAGTLTISGVVSDGAGGQLAFTQNGTGTTILTGTNTYTGKTTVGKGTLVVNGSIASGSTMNVLESTLSGTGVVSGSVNFYGGNLAPGGISAPGTLTVGNLNMIQASSTFRLGAPAGTNDLVNVIGNLSLYNSLTVRPQAGFTVGTYTLFTYGGTLTNGTTGISPISGLIGYGSTISTSTPGHVDLVVSYLGGGQFWDGGGAVNDGAIAGGSGNWSAAGNNWTTSTGSANSTWQSGTAIFGGTAGTVTLTSPINTQAVFFNSNGYIIAGSQTLTLVGAASAINVANSGTAATISAKLAGVAGLTTGGPGTLILTNGANSYSGGTTIYGGTLQIGTIATAGSLGSGAVLVENGGTLNLMNVAGSSVANNISSAIGGVNTVQGGAINTLTLSGTLKDGAAGQLALNVAGTGTLILTNAGNTYTGSTTVSQANLQIGTTAAAGSIGTNSATKVRAGGKLTLVNVSGNSLSNSITNDGSGVGTVVANSANSITLSGALTDGVVGQMAFTQSGTGTTTLSGTSAYGGATTVSAGTLQIGNGISGNLTGSGAVTVSGTGILATNLADGATFAPNIALSAAGASVKAIQSGTNTISGLISGTGTFNQNGSGTTILNKAETYTGATTINAGTLEVDNSLAAASVVKVLTGGTLAGTGTIKGNTTMTGNGAINFGSGGNIVGTLGITGGNWNGLGTVNGLATSSSGAFNLNGNLTALTGLSVTGGTLAGTGTLTGKLIYASTASSTFGGVIAGTGTLAKSGTSTLTLTGDETYTGATTVSAGTLQIGNGSAGSLSGTSGVTVSGTGILAMDLADGAIFTPNIILSAAGASVKAIQSGTNTLSGLISGTGTFNQNGSGTTILNTAETYTGATTVTTGTLEVDNSLATASTVKVLTGGTLTGTGTIKGNATLTGNGIINFGSGGSIVGTLGITGGNWNGLGTASGLVTSSSGAFNLNGSLTALAGLSVTGGTLAGNGTLTGKLIYASTASSTFGGVIAGTGTLAKSGTSTLTLTGAETYTGATTVTAGTLQVGNGVSGSLTGTSGITVSGTGSLALNLADGSTFNPNITPAITLSAAGASVKAIQTGTTFISVPIGGTGTFNQNGTGTTILTGVETYTGATNINAGTLEVITSLATGSVVHVLTSGTLTGSGTIKGNATLTGNGTINFGLGGNIVGTLGITGGNWNGGGTVGGLVTSSSGAFHLNGGLAAPLGLSVTGGTLSGTGTLNGKLNYTSTTSSTFDGIVVGAGSTLTKGGASTLTLTGSSTYTGATTVSAGTLQVGNGNTAGASLGSGNVAVSSGATLAIDLANNGTFSNNVTDTGHITDIAPSGMHTIAGVISGTGTFAKTGAGTAILTGANTYTGATTVSSGTLLVNNTTGFGTGTGTVSVNNGGTLGGSGTVKALTLNSGGIIAPGISSFGTTLHATSMIWNAGGTLKLQLGSSGGDALALTGAFNKGTAGSYTLDLVDAGIVPGSYTLVTYASTNFLPANFTLELPTGYDGSLVQTSTSLSITLSLHASSVSGGTLTLNGNNSSGNGTTTLSGGILSTGTPSTYSGGTLIVTGANTTTISGATITLSGGTGTSNLAFNTGNLVLVPQGTVITSGATVSAGNETTLIKEGTSTLTLSGAYPVAVPSGTLISYTGVSTIDPSATLNLSEGANSNTTMLVNEATITSARTIPTSVDPLSTGIQTGTISGDPTLLSTTSNSLVSGNDPIPLTLTPTPEPGSAMLLAFGTSMLIGWRRRRRA